MLFEPFGKALDMWTKMATDSVAKTSALYGELDKMDAKNIEQLDGVFAEIGKLTKDTLTYQAALGSVWRKLTLESMQRFVDFGQTSHSSTPSA